MNRIKCEICPWACEIAENETGFCTARGNRNGRIENINYGRVAAIALDPIEKKPLRRFLPGSKILSVGSTGCNLRCPFCQNYRISMEAQEEIEILQMTPVSLVAKGLELVPDGNIGIAFTYNEPVTWYDFVLDTAQLSATSGLKNVMVTNGLINEHPLQALLPYIDGMNVDLKCFTQEGYRQIAGDLDTVKHTIRMVHKACHLEVTTLIVPGKNDTAEEIEALSAWLASVSPYIPLHLTRFFPSHQMTDKQATPLETLNRLVSVAEKHLKYVYVGNV